MILVLYHTTQEQLGHKSPTKKETILLTKTDLLDDEKDIQVLISQLKQCNNNVKNIFVSIKSNKTKSREREIVSDKRVDKEK